MNKAEKLLCETIANFFNDNFKFIDPSVKIFSLLDSKEMFINKIKNDLQLAIWAFRELSKWGMVEGHNNELEYLYVKQNNKHITVIRIYDKYLKIIDVNEKFSKVKFVKPKYKKIMYFN